MKNLGKINEGALNEIQLTDAIREEAINGDVYGYVFEGRRFDCGARLSYLEAIINIAFESLEFRDKIIEIMEGLNKKMKGEYNEIIVIQGVLKERLIR